MVTDIGIELGKALYWNRRSENEGYVAVRSDFKKLWLLISLVGLFFIGGVVGAVGFNRVGFAATVPLAVLLLLLAFVPIMDDVRVSHGVRVMRPSIELTSVFVSFSRTF